MLVFQGGQELNSRKLGWGEILSSALNSFVGFPISWPKDTGCGGGANPFQPQMVSWSVPLEVSSLQDEDLPGLATVRSAVPWDCHLQFLQGSWLLGLVKPRPLVIASQLLTSWPGHILANFCN